ncbi:sporulation protein [Stutzerimonas kirkiae]|uniref:Sporulation protein n=1 Tax=Stutzerimonas kirkiae TaxID=2211392 RepID=A0A4Q9QWM4_9GAMM|nr:SPOR domain-containing protein [Stutzerimonas kirkiae]TBU87502.1 sporulation protein [Stutzerimonas kirkiae]TBU97856.1 sporulation protein [Stutzerimonas kirkiae]TBV11430.1 sporulation protein [Stutzerimonas kirkiae]
MRWLFLLLLMLNAFFYIQHQHRLPLAPVEVQSPESRVGESIRLLSESQAGGDGQREETCLFLGGIDSEAALLDLRQRLLSLDIDSNVLGLDSVSGEDFWVYLPPLGSRPASLQQLRELQARNVDGYIIAEGDLANGISLGIFPRKADVDRLLARLQELGYEPGVRTLPRLHRKFWLRISPESRRLVSPEVLAIVLAAVPGVQSEQMPCKGIATESGFE